MESTNKMKQIIITILLILFGINTVFAAEGGSGSPSQEDIERFQEEDAQREAQAQAELNITPEDELEEQSQATTQTQTNQGPSETQLQLNSIQEEQNNQSIMLVASLILSFLAVIVAFIALIKK